MSKIAQETGSEWYFKWAGVLGIFWKNLTTLEFGNWDYKQDFDWAWKLQLKT